MSRIKPEYIGWIEYVYDLKLFIWNREDRKCFWCDKPLSLNKTTFDHIIPKSRGGPLTAENTVASCEPCNNERGNMPAVDFAYMKWSSGNYKKRDTS